MDEDLKQTLHAMQEQNAQAFAMVHREIGEIRRDMDVMRRDNSATHAETRSYFDEVATRLAEEIRYAFDVASAGTRSEMALVTEAIVILDKKLDRTAARLDEKIDRTAAETQALVQVSYSALDRRIRTLEER